MMKENAIIQIPNGNKFFVRVSAKMSDLHPGDSVLVEQKNLTVHNVEVFFME